MVCPSGRLRLFYYHWRCITSDPVILSWIKGYKIPFIKRAQQYNIPLQPQLSKEEVINYKIAIDDLVNIGAVSVCQSCDEQFLSKYFLIKKPNGKYRFILNLKSLNKFIKTEHFKLEDLRTTLKLVTKDHYMASLDLKDAYFLVSIHPCHRKYLRFQWQDQLFEFNVLPFGLNTAPYVFTKLLKPVMSLLRSLGILCSIYLDDFWTTASSIQNCRKNITQARNILESLGFLINEEKSSTEPDTTCKYLGFVIDSKKFHLRLTDEKRSLIKQEIQQFLNLKRCTIRKFARMVGLLTSACPAIQYGWLYTKDLERCKYLALLRAQDYDDYMTLPLHLQSDLKWWLSTVTTSVNPLRDDKYVMEIFSDASKKGWGAACGEETASGQWNSEECNMHINYLELMAAFFGIKIFAKDLQNCQLLLRIDNTTAISYVNRMGGVRFPHLNKITKALWQWCENRNIFVFASYISSEDNELADAESRRSHPDNEWVLRDFAFRKIQRAFGNPNIDLFASRINKKCEQYVSWHRDPEAFAINAFTLDWSNINFYAFPPVAVILKVLRKIISDKAEGIVVVPQWPTQPWYPLFRKLLCSNVITFTPSDKVLLPNSTDIQQSITLVAGRLSGQLC